MFGLKRGGVGVEAKRGVPTVLCIHGIATSSRKKQTNNKNLLPATNDPQLSKQAVTWHSATHTRYLEPLFGDHFDSLLVFIALIHPHLNTIKQGREEREKRGGGGSGVEGARFAGA